MRSHRALSSVVGAVFLIAIVIGSLSYISYSLEIMGSFSEALITEESRLKDKQSEAFQISSIDIVAGKLDGVIKNTGEIPIKLTTLWIDEQGANDVVQKYTLDTIISPGNTVNIINLADVDVVATKGYNMKVVSSRGEVNSFFVNSPNQQSLNIQLFAVPEIVPTNFSTTVMMTVVNNMTNNNVLVNLTPEAPISCIPPACTIISGPIPTSYDSLEAGDVAIFRWVYKLTGLDQDTFSFTGKLQNGIPTNKDTATVTIGVPEFADVAGQSILSLGFGQSELSPNSFVFHTETYGIPPTGADYQMSLTVPDTEGTTILFDTGIEKQWFSANATVQDIDIPAGNWNASLRYNSPRLPDGMAAGADTIWELFATNPQTSEGGGHIFHFTNNEASGLYDSVLETACSNLSTTAGGGSRSGVIHYNDRGVNGSGAYFFDGNDYITIAHSLNKKTCNNIDKFRYSLAGWFNGTNTGTDNIQTIYSNQDGSGGIELELSTGIAGHRGHVVFTSTDKDSSSTVCEASDANYIDNNWHHFVAVLSPLGTCKLYIDGTLKNTGSGGNGHLHQLTDVYLGSKSGTSNFFTGYIDDIMFWNNYALTAADVTALKQASFGDNAHRINFVINNATGSGTTVSEIVRSDNYGLQYVDQGRYTDKDTLWTGDNYTATILNPVGLKVASENRLNFTMSYAGGFPLNLRVDDDDLKPPLSTISSTYLQVPAPPDPLPVFNSQTQSAKVTFFAYNAGSEGVWFTYQGTRIVFNGTAGHFTGIIDTVSDGTTISTMNANTDSPFIKRNSQADLVFWQPQAIPKASTPSPGEEITPGNYVVSVYISGYDEDGTIFVRSLNLGTMLVVQ